ncbi:MAG: glycosyltransferase [Candidatus Micrarchaeota archaeon]
MDYKDLLRPPYRIAKSIWEWHIKNITNLQLLFHLIPMSPPKPKVQKSRKIKKILLAMMKYDYGIKERGLSLEYYNTYLPLKELGYEVEMFDFMTVLQDQGRKKMNSLLFDTVVEFDPDLVFFSLFQEQFDKNTVRKISETTRSITLNWFSDDDWRFYLFSKFWAPCFNFCITTHEESYLRYISLGYTNIIMSQFAANPSICKKLKIKKDINVSFVGAAHGLRKSFIELLNGQGILVQCFGSGWKNGRVSQDEMMSIFNRSKINLNLCTSSTKSSVQMKARLFEIPACGAFMLTDYVYPLEKYFELNKEICIFDNPSNAAEKIRYYLSHDREREQIASSGYTRCLTEHTYIHRLRSIISEIEHRGC